MSSAPVYVVPPLLTGPAELAALLEADVPQWQRVVAEAGIRVE